MTLTGQRFTRTALCPICGGFDSAPRGQGGRCFGFLSSDHTYAHCTREEHPGGLPVEPDAATYDHRLGGDCRCGVRHRLATADKRPAPDRPRVGATYCYVDECGELLFQVVRYSPNSFTQRRLDERGGWISDLEGVRWVPYRLHDSRVTTATAPAAFSSRFELHVAPECKLAPDERERRAMSARREHVARMALATAKAGRTRTAGPREADRATSRDMSSARVREA